MPKSRFNTKYIIDHNDSRLNRLGKEGYERSKIFEAVINVAPVFFVSHIAFNEYLSQEGYFKEMKQSLSYDDKELIKHVIQKGSLQEMLVKELEDEFTKFKLHDKHPLIEVRLANSDAETRYVENIKPIIIDNVTALCEQIKLAWIDSLNFIQEKTIVQITQILPYDVTGFCYIDKERELLEINAAYGIWLQQEDYEQFDNILVNYSTLNIDRYSVGNQKKMSVKVAKEIKEVNVSSQWKKAHKLSRSNIEELLDEVQKLIDVFGRSIEFSYGIFKNKVYLHDLRYLPSTSEISEYFFADDFFNNQSDIDIDTFKNELEAISAIELPFFIAQKQSEIEKNMDIESKKDTLHERLKLSLNAASPLDKYKNKIGYFAELSAYHEVYRHIDDYKGFYLNISDLLKTLEYLNNKNSSEIYKVFDENIKAVARQIESLRNKEIIFKISDLKERKLELKNSYLPITRVFDINPIKRIGIELMVLRDLINKYKYENISISLPPVNTLEELQFMFGLFNLSGFSVVAIHPNKFYVNVSSPALVFEMSRKGFNTQFLLDGIIFDMEVFMKNFYKKNIFSRRDKKLALEYLEDIFKKLSSSQLDLIIRLGHNEDIIEDIMQYKPGGVIVHSDLDL